MHKTILFLLVSAALFQSVTSKGSNCRRCANTNAHLREFCFETGDTPEMNLPVIALPALNVVYVGLKNPISIASSGHPSKNLRLYSSCGLITKGGNYGEYFLYIERLPENERYVTLSIFLAEGLNDSTKIGERNFRIRKIPQPTPMLGSIEESGLVSLGQLRIANFVITSLKDFAFEGVSFYPTAYTLSYLPLRGKVKVMKGYNTNLSEEMKKYLYNAKSGDKFILSDVIAESDLRIIKIEKNLELVVK